MAVASVLPHILMMKHKTPCIAPAFARLMVLPMILLNGGIEGLTFFKVIWWVTPITLAAIALVAWRLKNWHPALILAAIGNLSIYACAWIGDAPWWRAVCQAMFLPTAS